ncbi:MAG: helix-turn-helix domain-containing protein [archaeon]
MTEFSMIIEKIDALQKSMKTGFPAWLSVKQCADHLSVSSSQIRKLIASGSIPYRRVGQAIRFNRRQIDLWLLSGDVKPNKRARSTFEAFL